MPSGSLKTKLQNLQRSLEELNKNEYNTITPSTVKTYYLALEQVIQNLCTSLLSEEELRLLCACCFEYIDSVHVLATKLNSCRYSKRCNIVQGLLSILATTAELLGDLRTDFIEHLTPAILQQIDIGDTPWFFKILMKTFKECLQHTIRRKRHKIFVDNLTKFLKLIDTICYCGDYSYQATLIEIIFRVCSSEQIRKYADDFFSKSDELKNGLINVKLDNFDVHLRELQNLINTKFKTIFSIKCTSVFLDNLVVAEPEDVGMWVDFNIGFKSISFFCDSNCLLLDTINKDKEDGWETITVVADSVSSVTSSSWKLKDKMSNTGKIICFTLETPCICVYPSSYQAKEHLTLILSDSAELKELELKILPEMFGNKFNATKTVDDFSKNFNSDYSALNTKEINKVLKISHQQFIITSSRNDALDKFNDIKKSEYFNTNYNSDYSALKDKRINNVIGKKFVTNSSKNYALENKLTNGNISRSDSRPSLSVLSSPHSSIFSDTESYNKYQNLPLRQNTNAFYNKYSRNKTNLSHHSIRECDEFGYEIPVSEEASFSEEVDSLTINETYNAKKKTSTSINYIDDRLKSTTSELSNSNSLHVKISSITSHNQNVNILSENVNTLLSKPRDSESKLPKPIPKYKSNRTERMETVSVYECSRSKRETYTPLPTINSPNREISEKISKSKFSVSEGITYVTQRKNTKICKNSFESLSSEESMKLHMRNCLGAQNEPDEKNLDFLRPVLQLTELNDNNYAYDKLQKINKTANSAFNDFINSNDNKLNDMKTATKEISTTAEQKFDSSQKIEEIRNEIQANVKSLGSPIISITNIGSFSISQKEITNYTESVKTIKNGNELTDNSELEDILKYSSASFKKLEKVNSFGNTQDNINIKKKIIYLSKTLKPCKVNLIKEDLNEKLNQIKLAVKGSLKTKEIKLESSSLTGDIQNETATQHFSKKRKCEQNVTTSDKMVIKRPKINIISNMTIVPANDNTSLKTFKKTKCRKLCDINDLSFLKQWNLQKKENESNLNFHQFVTTACSSTMEKEVSVCKVRELNRDTYFNFNKQEKLRLDLQSSIEKEKSRRKFNEFLNEFLKSTSNSPEISTPPWCNPRRAKKVPAYKTKNDVKRTTKTLRSNKNKTYRKEENFKDHKVDSTAVSCNKVKKAKQTVNIKECVFDGIKPVKATIKNLETNFSVDSINDMNYTKRIEIAKRGCIGEENVKSWIVADPVDNKEEIFEKMESFLKLSTDLTEEALEIWKGPIPPHRKALYDFIYHMNANLENYFEKCNNSEANAVDIDPSFFSNI